MKCVIFGGSFYNKGAEAMSICVMQQLYERGICTEFNFISFNDLYKLDKEAIKNLNIKAKINQLKLPQLRKFVQALVLPKMLYKKSCLSDIVMAIEQSDFIIDISGYTLCDKFGIKPALSFYIRTVIANKYKKPHIIFPQAMGPFNNSKVAKFAKKSIENSQLVILRDEKTLDYVRNLNVNNMDKIKLLPDIAFLFHQRYRKKVKSGINNIIVVPNVRAYEKSYDGDNNYYLDSLIKVMRDLPKNSSIYLLPHEYGNSGFDDVALCKEIVNRLGNSREIILIDKQHSAIELKNIISEADLIISSRFHAAIAGLSMGIPTITVGWADKYPQLLKLFECEEFAVDVSELKTNKLSEKVNYIIKNEDEISNKISRNLIKVKANSNRVFESLEQFLGDKK